MKSALDASILEGLHDVGGEAFVAELISLVIAQMPERQLGVHRAHQAGDLVALGQVAHALKGSALQVGALDLAERAGTLEVSAKAGDRDAVAREVPALEAEIGVTLRLLNAELATAPTR